MTRLTNMSGNRAARIFEILAQLTQPKTSEIAQIGDPLRIETPSFAIHTLSGSIPHITSDVYHDHLLPNLSQIPMIGASLDSVHPCIKSMKSFPHGFPKFVGLQTAPLMMTLQDPLNNKIRSGFNDKNGIAIWSREGKKKFDIKDLSELIDNFKPSHVQLLHDYDVSFDSTTKRIQKSCDRILKYLKEYFQLREAKSDVNVRLMVTIDVAWFVVEPSLGKRVVGEIMSSYSHKITGFTIAGLRFDSERSGDLLHPEAVDELLGFLPQNHIKFAPGAYSLEQMTALIKKGIDVMDSSVVTRMSEDGEVFFVHNEGYLDSNNSNENEDLPTKSETLGLEEPTKPNETFSTLNLKEKRFTEKFTPICYPCDCYTCRNFTVAYIHHLFETDELLGPVLLMLHNLSFLDKYFHAARSLIKSGESLSTRSIISSGFNRSSHSNVTASD